MNHKRLLIALTAASLLAGCDAPTEPASPGEAAETETPEITNRVDIPGPVRRNLGITFVTVERRRVAHTLRVPGSFELSPRARREYRTMLPGRVELVADHLARVQPGEVLFRIDSPAWRELQRSLSDADSAITRLTVKMATFETLEEAHDAHLASLERRVAAWSERVEQLEAVRDAGGGRSAELAQSRAELASANAEFADLIEGSAKIEADRAESAATLAAARSSRELLLKIASSALGLGVDELVSTTEHAGASVPRWRAIDRIEVRCEDPGVVESLGLTEGAWADERSAVLTVVRPDMLRFRAAALQSDLVRLSDGLDARIVAPSPSRADGSIDLIDTMSGKIRLGVSGEPADRTIEVFVTPESVASWARPGVAAHLEIDTSPDASAELAVPLAAVQRDGLEPVLFRRDPKDANRAIRLVADLGADDGRWVTVLSGLTDGDEVVLDGGFQLMLATSGTASKGGHFHADGTFHEGED